MSDQPTRTEKSILRTASGRGFRGTSLEVALAALNYSHDEARRVFEIIAREEHQQSSMKVPLPQHMRAVVERGMKRYRAALEASRGRFR